MAKEQQRTTKIIEQELEAARKEISECQEKILELSQLEEKLEKELEYAEILANPEKLEDYIQMRAEQMAKEMKSSAVPVKITEHDLSVVKQYFIDNPDYIVTSGDLKDKEKKDLVSIVKRPKILVQLVQDGFILLKEGEAGKRGAKYRLNPKSIQDTPKPE